MVSNLAGPGGGAATGGDYIIYGDDGTKNHTYSSVYFNGGKGGASHFGRGASLGSTQAGVQGGGGRGSSAPASGGGSNGTDGGAGMCVVEEYK